MKKLFLGFAFIILTTLLSSVAWSEHLTCDLQDAALVTKYRINLNGEILDAGIEKVGEDQVRIYYNIDHLDNGQYEVKAAAGNDKGQWSTWSNIVNFYIGVPVPQTLGLYIPKESARISQGNWKVFYVSSEESERGYFGRLSFDGDPKTYWHSNWRDTDPETKHPHEIQIDLGKEYQNIQGLYYLSRQDESWKGTVKSYKIYTSVDGIEWTEAVKG